METKYEIKQLFIEANEFEVGDLVVNKTGNDIYFIYDYGYTLLHHHKIINVMNSNGEEEKLFIHEIHGKRKVIRFVEKPCICKA